MKPADYKATREQFDADYIQWQRVASVNRVGKWFYTARLNNVQYWIVQNRLNDKWQFDNMYGDKSKAIYETSEMCKQAAIEFSKTHQPVH